jgi:hypothetical protein
MKRALLFSGGLSPKRDKLRYRNNLAAFYRVLTGVYHYPKEEIRVCLSGGGWYDFDQNGQDEPYTPATREHLFLHLEWLSAATEQDTIVFVASNHGDRGGLCLWKDDSLVSPKQIETALASCAAQKVFILGQCHSGIFGYEMKLSNSVVCCACSEEEESLPVPYQKGETPIYDEFFYHMIGALGGQYPDGLPSASLRPTNEITLYEACVYARKNDRNMKTPLFFPEFSENDWPQGVRL